MARSTRKKKRLGFRELAARLSGLSVAGLGVSWAPSQTEREIVREVFVFLEDRRVLFAPFLRDANHFTRESVEMMRAQLTEAVQHLPEDSPTADHLRAMRAACRRFLDDIFERTIAAIRTGGNGKSSPWTTTRTART